MTDAAPERGSEGNKLTRAAVVNTAIELADVDGFGAVTMRKIADRLGVGTMSLYRHVSDKDALLMAMSDEIGVRFPYPPAGDATWRERARIAAEVDWTLYQRHPWVLLAFASPRSSMGPQSLNCLDWLTEGFMELKVTTADATEMALSLWNHIAGTVLGVVAERLLHDRADDDSEGQSGLTRLLAGNPDGVPPPHLAELVGTGNPQLNDPRYLLDQGVEALCDGFEARARRLR
ncbi:UNVERIFIED_CONTAM: TetR family transcriptional regulator [Williamsia faeni]